MREHPSLINKCDTNILQSDCYLFLVKERINTFQTIIKNLR